MGSFADNLLATELSQRPTHDSTSFGVRVLNLLRKSIASSTLLMNNVFIIYRMDMTAGRTHAIM